ncbi:uncharacterized protein BT62DRAFT_922239 [Guyanagaster necrorhizus]|uniref:Rhamnogalacturonase B N-terminal domain-containing protein n=1 Tax=Guyanagaster necrorhizus TaxID=856835 RepID=A0A9P7VM63_9AGAR|nr:uncharacterized protein BT62DRAFT_922239 [Guyanagaster necrorhizus MCA 3950]KAG7443147.1 hypothetical protein BT62DRAFT_922239 [Guyanagaster necrorhizus MCA 3950]
MKLLAFILLGCISSGFASLVLQHRVPTCWSILACLQQLSSGLESATVTSAVDNDIAVVTIETDTIKHYYIVRSEPSVDELRFIARLSKDELPNGNTKSEVNGGTAIEGSDVFELGGDPIQVLFQHTYRQSGKHSTGSLFLHEFQTNGELSYPIFRTVGLGVHFEICPGNDEWISPFRQLRHELHEDLGLEGYVASSDRCTVSGTYSETLSSVDVTIGFSNDDVQYWTPAFAALDQGELAAGTASVTVEAGSSATLELSSSLDVPDTIWNFGTVDGTPSGSLNADLIERMHPSDSRMSDWVPVMFTYQFELEV